MMSGDAAPGYPGVMIRIHKRSTAALGRVLAGVLSALLLAGCASWAQSSGSELDRAGKSVSSQVEVLSLVAAAALRHEPYSANALGVMVSDARSELATSEDTITGVPQSEHGRTAVLWATRDCLRLARRVAAALEAGDRATLAEAAEQLLPIRARLQKLGMS